MDITQAIDHVNKSMGGFAVPVQTCKEMAAACSTGASKSANFKRKDAGQGWVIETWEPTWFCFDGEPFSCPKPSTRAGSDAPQILADLGYTNEQIAHLQESGAIGPVEWY